MAILPEQMSEVSCTTPPSGHTGMYMTGCVFLRPEGFPDDNSRCRPDG